MEKKIKKMFRLTEYIFSALNCDLHNVLALRIHHSANALIFFSTTLLFNRNFIEINTIQIIIRIYFGI